MFFVPEGSGKSAEKRENRRDFPWLSVVRDSQFVQNANPHYPRDSALFGDTAQPDSALSWTALSLTLFFHCMFNFWSTGCTFTKVHKIFLWCQMGRIKKMLQIPKNVVKILRLCSKISGNLCAIKSACRWKEKICDFPCTRVKVSHQLPKGKHLHANSPKPWSSLWITKMCYQPTTSQHRACGRCAATGQGTLSGPARVRGTSWIFGQVFKDSS